MARSEAHGAFGAEQRSQGQQLGDDAAAHGDEAQGEKSTEELLGKEIGLRVRRLMHQPSA